jgi:hypothetical protein
VSVPWVARELEGPFTGLDSTRSLTLACPAFALPPSLHPPLPFLCIYAGGLERKKHPIRTLDLPSQPSPSVQLPGEEAAPSECPAPGTTSRSFTGLDGSRILTLAHSACAPSSQPPLPFLCIHAGSLEKKKKNQLQPTGLPSQSPPAVSLPLEEAAPSECPLGGKGAGGALHGC